MAYGVVKEEVEIFKRDGIDDSVYAFYQLKQNAVCMVKDGKWWKVCYVMQDGQCDDIGWGRDEGDGVALLSRFVRWYVWSMDCDWTKWPVKEWTRVEVERVFQEEGVDPEFFSKESCFNRDDAVCYELQDDGWWMVFYTERGQIFPDAWTKTEQQALRVWMVDILYSHKKFFRPRG